MKKIAILTLVSYNQGNRLQNYALQTAIEKFGCKVETLQREKISIINRSKRFIRNYLKKDQYTIFNKFNKVINWSDDIVSSDYVTTNLAEHFDYFVIGSDQIWNPKIDNCTDCVYLPMVPPNKKLAYSASFGTTEFTNNEKCKIIPLIENIMHVSIREREGKEFVNRHIPGKAQVLIDPVLLLSADEWAEVEKKPRFLDEKEYIFKYILGHEKYKDYAKELSQNFHIPIIDLDLKKIIADPFEFVYLIHHANLVLTDSFHGSVFSIIFEKSFRILDRIDEKEDMSCRINSLCEMFNLHKNRGIKKMVRLDKPDIDYASTHFILISEREKAMQYLQNILR